jgi:hypothetical protein
MVFQLAKRRVERRFVVAVDRASFEAEGRAYLGSSAVMRSKRTDRRPTVDGAVPDSA